MRVTKEQAAANRRQILAAAAHLFRENGIEATGVDQITRRAGLTHGGLYSQFGSKNSLAAAAVLFASRDSARSFRRPERKNREQRLHKVVARYLSTTHRDARGSGCVLAALGTDVARQPRAVRHAFTAAVKGVYGLLAPLMPERDSRRRREKTIAAFSTMLGALILARAVDDESLSREILAASARRIKARPQRREGASQWNKETQPRQ